MSVSLPERFSLLRGVSRGSRLEGLSGRGPANEQAQGVLRGRLRLGGVSEEALAGIGGQGEGVVRQVDVADDRVVDELDAGGVDPDVMGGPAATEFVAAAGQLPNQIGKSPVIRMAAGLGVQQGDSVVGDLVPVAEELGRNAGRGRRTWRCWLA